MTLADIDHLLARHAANPNVVQALQIHRATLARRQAGARGLLRRLWGAL